MGYPQPSSESVVIANDTEFFRLNTPLFTEGDVYESRVGCHAIALGPESDISKVNVAYFDSSQQGNMGRFTVDPQRMFVSQINAQNDKQSVYTPANNEGRILFWPANLFNVDYRPSTFEDTDRCRIDFITPVLDVIQYFTPVPGVQSQRTDKSYHYQQIPWPFDAGSGEWFLVVPFYGRKYVSISFTHQIPGPAALTMAVKGANYVYAGSGGGADEFTLQAAAAVAPNTPTNYEYRASADGMFDLILIDLAYTAAGAVPTERCNLRITVSDNAL